MRFRPCIDIHNGKVKQIVGSTLKDEKNAAADNFVSDKDAAFYAELYKAHDLRGGHIIVLNPAFSEYYEEDVRQAKLALKAYEGGLQIGGGINDENAAEFLNCGASHVIVTSYVFRNGSVDYDRLKRLVRIVGKDRLTLDLSCKRSGDAYYIVTDRWQKLTDVKLCEAALEKLSHYCGEFLVHAADSEGKRGGIEMKAAEILASSPITASYAGGISSFSDIRLIYEIGGGRLDFTVGSALDLFGGGLSFEEVVEFCKSV